MTCFSHTYQKQMMSVILGIAVLGLFSVSPAEGEENPTEAKDLLPVTEHDAPDHRPVSLIQKGQTNAVISVMIENRNKKLKIATSELQECLKEITGAKLNIKRGSIPADGPTIVLAGRKQAASLGINPDEMKPEAFHIKTEPNRVSIVGNGPSGTAYGVFDFLERFVGVRWYWQKQKGGRYLPDTRSITIQPTWISDAPAFRHRSIFPSHIQNLGQFQTKLRSGSSWPMSLNVHGDSGLKKVKKYRKNKDIWQVSKDGSRNYTHPCYSSKETVDAFMREVRRKYEKGKEARIGVKGNTVTVSPADTGITCHGDMCRKLWDDDAGQYGTASKIMARFVARLGRRLKEEYPDKNLLYLPYQNYTLPPEGINFPDNVYVQMCHMPGVALYKEPDLRKRWQGYIDGWVNLTGHPIKDWHYSCWPADRTKAPYQYVHTVNNYYRRNREKTVGTFINGAGNHWPRFHPSLYVWMKSLWDPDVNVDAVMDEYCERMYGDASDTIRKILRTMTRGWEDANWPGASFKPKAMYETSYPKETLEQIKKWLDKAREQVKGNKLATRRVEYFAAPYAELFKEYKMVVEGKGKQTLVVQKVPQDPTVDGKLDEDVWNRAQAINLVTRKNGKEVDPNYPTRVKAVYTLNGITFGFHMKDPEANKLYTDSGGPDQGGLWFNDCVEIYLDPSDDGSPKFYQWIISAALDVYDARGSNQRWNAEGVKIEKYIGNDHWNLEVFIPLSTLENVDRLGTREWTGQITRHRTNKGNKTGGDETHRMNYESGKFNSSRADFCPIKFRE